MIFGMGGDPEAADPMKVTSVATLKKPQSPSSPEGSAVSGKILGDIARLSPDDALQCLSSTVAGSHARTDRRTAWFGGFKSRSAPGPSHNHRRTRCTIHQPSKIASNPDPDLPHHPHPQNPVFRTPGKHGADRDETRIAAVGMTLPFSSASACLGLVPLPIPYGLALAFILPGYAVLTHWVTTFFFRRYRAELRGKYP